MNLFERELFTGAFNYTVEGSLLKVNGSGFSDYILFRRSTTNSVGCGILGPYKARSLVGRIC